MRRQGPITTRHLIVAVLVMIVINAQLTWWVVFILRLNRTILEFERERLLSAAKVEAVRIGTHLETARTALEAAVLMGDEPGRNAVPAPFVGWRTELAVDQCPPAQVGQSGVVELRVESGLRCVSGVVGGEPRIQCQFVWKLGDNMTPEWPMEEGYRIELHGEPGVRCRLQPLDAAHFDGAVTTAMPVVNAIDRVCSAPPGIVNRMELPFVTGAHTVGRVGPVRH